MSPKVILELIGWAGAAASLSAFSLNSLNVIGSRSIQYLTLNVIGCFFLILHAFSEKARASWVLSSVWLLITLVELARLYIAG